MFDRMWSPDVRVMMHPSTAFATLTDSKERGAWLLARRPLLLALLLGSMASLMTERSLSLRLVLSGAATWSFVPVLEIVGLAAVTRGARRSFPQTVDLFFTGHAAWSLWIVATGAFWSWKSPASIPMGIFTTWIGTATGILVWSAYVDFHFSRTVLQRDRAAAFRDLLVLRALTWIPGIFIFGYGSLWADIVEIWR